MTVAVTGATGFIGRHVVAALDARGVSAVLVSRGQRPAPPALSAHRTVHFDLAAVPADAFERMGRPDTLIHLAWGGLPHYRSPHHLEQELPAQYAFLKEAIASGVRHLVVAGTCFEYGMQSGALAETDEARPSNPYALAKDTLRRQLEQLQVETPFGLTWARLFYAYGEGQSAGSLFPLLCAAAARGDREFPMSGGEQLRDYLPVADLAGQLVTLALDGAGHGIVNVCSGTPVSVRVLVERWIAEHGWHIVPALGRYPYPDYEPMAFWGDARKLRALTSRAATAPLS